MTSENELVCARCRRAACRDYDKTKHGDPRIRIRKWWPEGPICVKCYTDALNTYGTCSGCGAERLLPGISPAGSKLCTDCAGGLGDFTCPRCGQEGPRYTITACDRCVFTDRLATLLDDGAGAVRPELVPFYESVRAMPRPRRGLVWLSKPHVPAILRALARGDVPLTHAGLSTLQPWRSVAYVRELLIACRVLPPVDRFLLLFEQWLPGWLASINNPQHRQLLERFATWHVLRRLRLAAAEAPLTSYRANDARHTLRIAAEFLADLAGHGRQPDECTQADIDRWFAVASPSRQTARTFLRWCRQRREIPRLTLPPVANTPAAPLGQQQRIACIRRVLTDDTMPAADRVLALLILLYAQPLSLHLSS